MFLLLIIYLPIKVDIYFCLIKCKVEAKNCKINHIVIIFILELYQAQEEMIRIEGCHII